MERKNLALLGSIVGALGIAIFLVLFFVVGTETAERSAFKKDVNQTEELEIRDKPINVTKGDGS